MISAVKQDPRKQGMPPLFSNIVLLLGGRTIVEKGALQSAKGTSCTGLTAGMRARPCFGCSSIAAVRVSFLSLTNGLEEPAGGWFHSYRYHTLLHQRTRFGHMIQGPFPPARSSGTPFAPNNLLHPTGLLLPPFVPIAFRRRFPSGGRHLLLAAIYSRDHSIPTTESWTAHPPFHVTHRSTLPYAW